MTSVALPFPGSAAPGPLAPAAGCDCGSCPFWAGNPAAAEPVCSGCSSACSYCGCSRGRAAVAGGGDARGGCASCPVRCGSRTDIATWMADVGGTLALAGTRMPGTLPDRLPAFIPQVASIPAISRLDEHLRWPAYAVGLRRVFSWRTHQLYAKVKGRPARDVLGLGGDQLAVLAMYGDDPLIEGWWTWRRARGLTAEIAAQRWDLVLGPNYSVYGDQPRAEHLINMRRSALAAAELAAEGVTAVPNLYWYRLEDLRRWVSCAADSGAPAVAVNAQTVRAGGDWGTWLYPGLCWLAEHLPPTLPVIVTGLSRPDRIAAAAGLFGSRLTVISQCPYQYAVHGAVMTPEGRADLHARPADAFAASVRCISLLADAAPQPAGPELVS